MSQYAIDYSAAAPVQSKAPPSANDNHPPTVGGYHPPRGLRIPSILKTTAVFVSGAVLLFTCETYAPVNMRPSTVMGTYDARVAAAVKAAELEQQVQVDEYTAQLKLAADQNAEQYKATVQGVLNSYTATWDRGKIVTQAALEMQGRYASVILNQTQAEQGTDIGIINLVRGYGRIASALGDPSGDAARDYANKLSKELQDEATEAAKKGSGTPVVGWDTGLTSPQEVAATLASIKPLAIPAPPRIGERAVSIGETPTTTR